MRNMWSVWWNEAVGALMTRSSDPILLPIRPPPADSVCALHSWSGLLALLTVQAEPSDDDRSQDCSQGLFEGEGWKVDVAGAAVCISRWLTTMLRNSCTSCITDMGGGIRRGSLSSLRSTRSSRSGPILCDSLHGGRIYLETAPSCSSLHTICVDWLMQQTSY